MELQHLALLSLANAQDKKFKKLSAGEEKKNKTKKSVLSPLTYFNATEFCMETFHSSLGALHMKRKSFKYSEY